MDLSFYCRKVVDTKCGLTVSAIYHTDIHGDVDVWMVAAADGRKFSTHGESVADAAIDLAYALDAECGALHNAVMRIGDAMDTMPLAMWERDEALVDAIDAEWRDGERAA